MDAVILTGLLFSFPFFSPSLAPYFFVSPVWASLPHFCIAAGGRQYMDWLGFLGVEGSGMPLFVDFSCHALLYFGQSLSGGGISADLPGPTRFFQNGSAS